ncbi:hypothetical protein [Lelliottia sp. CFBP8978]|uniref:hypothetical protein n=1 Tax=Lelliottia sp. CFBP8978 TaxID=3096522 RepID=UPI002A6B011C|nr:hypothetical protein [Lelliottia sp. CFBP8978]MDY1038552.1 hypothetical protein [Lelliottia sp. CFBP8978]
MNITILSDDHFFAQSVLALCPKNSLDVQPEKHLLLVDVMNFSDYHQLSALCTPEGNCTLAFVPQHVQHFHFMDTTLWPRLSDNINIAVISRKAQVFEYQALFTNNACHIKHAFTADTIFTRPEINVIHSIDSAAPSCHQVNHKCLSAHKRAVMKKTHISSHAELQDVVIKHQALTHALTKLL